VEEQGETKLHMRPLILCYTTKPYIKARWYYIKLAGDRSVNP
jgi:hypothetical protein